jgi:thymidine kinase
MASLVTLYTVICDCGHKGKIIYQENDTPFASLREYYRTEGFISKPYLTNAATWDDVFDHLAAICPECGRELTIRNLIDPYR